LYETWLPTKQLVEKQGLDTNQPATHATDLSLDKELELENEKGKDKEEESNDDAWLEAYVRAEKKREHSDDITFPEQSDTPDYIYPPNILESTVFLFSPLILI
jgi:hypothetical protein